MPIQSINSMEYYYEMDGQGPPLLLLHGFTGSSKNWQPQVAQFKPHFRCLTLDMLGHGRSASPADPGRYQMARCAVDIITLLDQLQLDRCHLLGYSMGGRLALYTAVSYPQRIQSLILESSSPGLATPSERNERTQRDNSLADWIEANGVTAFVKRWKALPLWQSQQQLSQSVRRALHQQRLQNNPTGLANSLRGMGTGVQPSLWGALDQVTCPTLQIVGSLDPKFVAINQKMAQALPDNQLEIVPDAGHTVHLERPQQFNHLVHQFLANTKPAQESK